MEKILFNKKIIQITGLSVFFLLIVLYAGFVSRDLIFGVKIRNVSIIDGVTVTESIIKITNKSSIPPLKDEVRPRAT